MNKTKYIITTPYGGRYELDSEGHVLTYSNGLDRRESTIEELSTWKVLGICKIGPFGHIGPTIPLNRAIKEVKEWTFKNGYPRYTACDLDHGTRRIWGNWNYHGVRSLREVKR